MSTDVGGLLSAATVASRLNLPKSTVYFWLRNERMPGQVRLGDRWFVPVEIVEAIERGGADTAQLLASASRT